MGRSSVPASTWRRKSARIQQLEAAASASEDSVGASGRKSSSSKESSASHSSKSTSSDGPHRRLRSKSSKRGKKEDDRKPIVTTATKSTGRKRSSSETTSSTRSLRSLKKKKSDSNLSVSTGGSMDSSERCLRSRRPRQLLNQVTPSPASAKTSPTSPVFSFNSPITKRRSKSTLPMGVVELYPANPQCKCHCAEDHCSSSALSASYIHAYGKDYWQHMKDTEEPVITPPSPTSSGGRSSIFASPESTDSRDSFYSHSTPDRRRDYVHIDTSCLDVAQPNESTKFLHYQPELTPKMRSILVDWIIELSEHFNFGPSTLHLAVTLVDKVLACGPLSMDDDFSEEDSGYDDGESKTNCFLISRERFQLLGAACTWLACKVEELSPPTVSEIAYVSDNIYTSEQIKRMERRICTALKFCLTHQTPYPYVFEFIRASEEIPNSFCRSGDKPVFRNMVLYLLELGRLPYLPVTKKPSLLAAAAIYLARCTLGTHGMDASPVWTRTLEYYTGYRLLELKETVLAIHSYHLAAEDSTLKSVFIKYKSKKYNRVALKTVPRAEDLGF